MTAQEQLQALLECFRENVPEAEFIGGWAAGIGTRFLRRPVVTGEIDSETVKPGSNEVKFRFCIYLSPDRDAGEGEALFEQMCQAAGERFPGFSAISRGAVARDKLTGAAMIACSVSFVSQAGGGQSGGGTTAPISVSLGGRTVTATGVKTSFGGAKDLTEIGEEEPFFTVWEPEYTVELEGVDVSGLDRLAVFTAVIGAGENAAEYERCRWKSLSDSLGRAVFVSRKRLG